MIDWIQKKLETWEGIAASVMFFAGLLAASWRFLLPKFRAGYRVSSAVVNIEETLVARDEALKKALKDIIDRLDRLDEGQQNLIQGRRGMMEEDAAKAWFECDEHGKFTWANRLWRSMTGMESDHVRGHGWEAGIEATDREEFLKHWKAAFDHERIFEERATLVSRITQKRTEVQIATWPVRHATTGRILSYFGHATVVRLPA